MKQRITVVMKGTLMDAWYGKLVLVFHLVTNTDVK
jgi:hypothetical protein